MNAALTNFHYGPILGLYAKRVQHGFYMLPALNMLGREILGNLVIDKGSENPEGAYQYFSEHAAPEDQVRFVERQFQVAQSFTDGVTNWVNLMPSMLNNQFFIDWLEAHLLDRKKSFFRTTYHRRVQRVGFEIVERGVLNSAAVACMARLARAGYPIAFDDVGAPGGSFATGLQVADMLKAIPATKLKIDRSLVVDHTPEYVADTVLELVAIIGRQQMRSVTEITIEGVPVNPHANELLPKQFVTERAQQLFAAYRTNAEKWKWALHKLSQQLQVDVSVQLAPVKYTDFEQKALVL